MLKNNHHYDIIFVGWGASTCILLIEMAKQSLLNNKKLLIIEPSEKLENDKTFCFWANREDEIYKNFSSIISKSWTRIQINDNESNPINPTEYFHVDSIDLYNWTRKIMLQYNIEHSRENVFKIEEKEYLIIDTLEKQYSSDWIFDSRPPNFKNIPNGEFNISQSFFGLKVELIEKELDESVYHMMDFRIPQDESTQFVYILPYTPNSALIELTRFGKKIIDKLEAEKELDKFINKNFGSYKVISKEEGVIPMSSNLPEQSSGKKWVNIGTRAGNVKPSTGYAFKNMYRHAKLICHQGVLKAEKLKPNKRFLFYDQLLLIILTIWPTKGKPIFERLFNVKSSHFVLDFLDEKTSLKEELSMFYKLQIGIFIKSIFYWFHWKFKNLLFPILMFDESSASDELINLSSNNLAVLTFGLLIIGIPHGALDHLTEILSKKNTINFKFIFYYLMMMVPVLLIWFWLPVLGLVFFLIYSAWHFGQTEINNWKIASNSIAILWGIVLFSSLFLIHFEEFSEILLLMNIEVPLIKFNYVLAGNLFLIVPFLTAIYYQKLEWLIIVAFFLLSNNESLLLTFGLYFIFQHSRIGWMHLKNELKQSHLEMFKNSLPFNIGAIFLYIIAIYYFNLSPEKSIAYFFIFISAISFPHVICMHFFYKKNNIK